MKKVFFLLFGVAVLFMNSRFSYGFDYVTEGQTHKKYVCPNLTQPAKGDTFNDPDFNTPIVRVTDCARDFGGNTAAVRYCKTSPLNVTKEYLILEGYPSASIYDASDETKAGCAGNVIYDWKTYEFLECPPHVFYKDPYGKENGDPNKPPEYRWDSRTIEEHGETHPKRLYYRHGTCLYYCEIQSGWSRTQSVLVHDFKNDYPSATSINSMDEGEPDKSMRYWPFAATSYGQLHGLLVYDMYEDKIVGEKLNPPSWINFIDIDPTGNYVVCSWTWSGEGGEYDGPHAYNLDFTNPVKVGNETKHSNWSFLPNGNVAFVQDFYDWGTATDPHTGSGVQYFHGDDCDWYCSRHLARFFDPEVKGWTCWGTYWYDNPVWGTNQLMMIELKPRNDARWWRVAHNYTDYDDYWAEAWPALSYDAQILFWNSNWGAAGPKKNLEVYAAILPDQWWIDLADPSSDSIPPVISNVACSDTTDSSTTITWMTNEYSTSQVEYGTTLDYGSSTPLNSNLVKNHTQTLNGLKSSTKYYYRVKSKDASDNLAVSDPDSLITKPGQPGRPRWW